MTKIDFSVIHLFTNRVHILWIMSANLINERKIKDEESCQSSIQCGSRSISHSQTTVKVNKWENLGKNQRKTIKCLLTIKSFIEGVYTTLSHVWCHKFSSHFLFLENFFLEFLFFCNKAPKLYPLIVRSEISINNHEKQIRFVAVLSLVNFLF